MSSPADGPDAAERLAALTLHSAGRQRRRIVPTDVALTLATYASLFIVMLPLLRVVRSGGWTLGIVLLPALVLGVGWIARRYGLPAVAVSLAEAVVGVLALTTVFLSSSALLGVIPTPHSVGEGVDLVSRALDLIVNGAAPLKPTPGLEFAIVGGMLVLTIVVDHVVLTARMPLLAAVALVAVWLIPSIAVPSDFDVLAFVLLAGIVLVILRLETRSRELASDSAASSGGAQAPAAARARAEESRASSGGITAAAAGIGAVAVVVALVAAPVFSGAVVRAGSGAPGRWNTIDASLQLGDDLRRQSNAEVLRLRTTAAAAPYLRIATLSHFDGKTWQPDRGQMVPLSSENAFGAVVPDDEITVIDTRTSIQIINLVSRMAPVSYPAAGVEGLGDDWVALPFNGTVVSPTGSINGADYSVDAATPRPTLEQIRASRAAPVTVIDANVAVPPDLPEIVRDLAREVTSGTTNDYDALIALQRWFRSSEFEYSLEAPVEDGFDGTGVEAVARFLEVKKGYCVHFAAAFVLMARTLGMPARIVEGYLPGSAMSDAVMGDRMFSVMASQLHAWPEVLFEGIGWISFEPTNSLGTPTSFSPAFVGTDPLFPDDETTTPTPTTTAGATDGRDGLDEHAVDASASRSPAATLLPLAGWLVGITVVLAIPAVVRVIRRRDLLRAAAAGDAGAAWRSLQDEAIDLGIAVPPDESPRAFGARLVAEHDAPPDAVSTLVSAIESASYAPAAPRWSGRLDEPVTAVRGALRAGADRRRRMLSAFAPRSLLVRPGSAYADGLVAARGSSRR